MRATKLAFFVVVLLAVVDGHNSVSVLLGAPSISTGPSISIDSFLQGAAVTGAVPISGWAVGGVASAAVVSVQVFVDSLLIGNAVYGSPRPDVCVVYTGRSGCPNIGFTYLLNTSALPAGLHTIMVTATDVNGNSYISSYFTTILTAPLPSGTCLGRVAGPRRGP
jgi:hypothetical protein